MENQDQQNQTPAHDGKNLHVASNHPFTGEELKHRLEEEPGSLGLDLDGTNPGSRSHPMDDFQEESNPPDDEVIGLA